MPDPVRAAGGVLYRRSGGRTEVCLVHRTRYDDWSLPKGKLDVGEHPLVGAAREVVEETGVSGRPELRLPTVEYVLPDGSPKTVDFWLMRAAEGPLRPMDAHEVDLAAWLPIAEAVALAGYADDRRLLEHVAGLPPVTGLTGLVRHAHAGDRKKWAGNDLLRPLDGRGHVQAGRIATVYALLEPERLAAATPMRCTQTIEPLAALLGGMPIGVDDAFAEPPDVAEAPAKAKLAAQRLVELRTGPRYVICSQGKIIPPLLAELRDEADPAAYRTPKGTGWLLTWSGDRLLGLSRL